MSRSGNRRPGAAGEDLLYRGDRSIVRAIRRLNGKLPAKEWFDGLDRKGKGQFLAAMNVLENSLRSGRPTVGRAEKVKGSREGLWELKVTKPGSTPPHLRLLYVAEGRTLWAAHGFTKQKNKLQQADIEKADAIVDEWRRFKEEQHDAP